MTDPVIAPEPQNPAPVPAPHASAAEPANGAVAAPQPASADSGAVGTEAADGTPARAGQGARRGGRNRRSGKGRQPATAQPAGAMAAAIAEAGAVPQAPRQAGGPRRTHPVLEQLAGFYPHLFGAQFLPLKRGIFQDLQDAHPGAFEKEDLKAALGIHTRSTRYLQVVAEGRQRHDLQGQAVEAMAPEHIHHALLEVFRRKKPRDGEDLVAKLRRRIAQAYEASGLTREAYDALVRGRDERANALLDEAFAEVAERDAKAEALLRAYEASGSTSVEQFADMYGMEQRNVGQMLARARQLRGPAAA